MRHRLTDGRRQHGDEGRAWNDSVTKGTARFAGQHGSWKEGKEGLFPEPPEGAWILWHFEFRLLVSITVKE